jgi:hypothetical protein
MINWINQRFGIHLDANDLESIKDFALIWNIFERFVCNNNFTIATVEQSISQKKLQIANFQEKFDYFKERYTENGQTNNRFNNLHFRGNDRENFVRQVLLANNNTVQDMVLTLSIIVHRFRNNLFHGIKDIQVIHEQRTNFEQANSFLKTLLDYY